MKKRILAIVTCMTLVAMVAPSASALTIDELMAQIVALQAQLAALQGQVTAPAASSFTTNLYFGIRSAAVTNLQNFLISKGYLASGLNTSYFGNLTKAAVMAYQTAKGITPVAGYFGPLTRAAANADLGATPSPTTTTSPTPTTTVVPAGSLTVALASDSPVATTIVSDGANSVAGSQALVDALHVKFSTAAGTTAKVTKVVLKRTGLASDSDIDNVYLYDGATKLAEMSSISIGVVTFQDTAGLFSVSGDKVITVKFDLNKDASASKTIGFQILAATDVASDNASLTVSGSFPVAGALMTTATVTDFGRLAITGVANSATVDPGTTGFEAMKMTFAASNQNVKVYSIKLLMLGSINTADIANISLYDGATLLATVASVASGGTVTFDMSAAPLTVNSGVSKNLSVKIDVLNGSTRTIQFSLQRATDILVMDANYNVYIKVDSGTVGTFSITSSTQTTVNSGSLVITKASTSPTGNVALNATGVTLAEYSMQAVGEGIKVSQLGYTVKLTTATNIKNVQLIFDGSQVGTTQTSVATQTTVALGGTATTVTTNFTVPAGTTKSLLVKADIASASGAADAIVDTDTIAVTLEISTSAGQRLVSLGTLNVPTSANTANTLTVSASSLAAVKNSSVGNPTLIKGSAYQRLASFLLTAGASEAVSVSAIAFIDDNGTLNGAGTQAIGSAFTNLKVMSGGAQVGSTKVTSTSEAIGTIHTFYPASALNIPAGTSVQVDVYGDILSAGAWTTGEAVELDSVTGTGAVTNSAANVATSAGKAGQTITLATSGSITAAVDGSAPTYTQVAAGASDQVMAVWKYTATTVEDLVINQIKVTNSNTTTGDGNVRNLRLFVGGVQVGSAVPALDATGNAWFRNLTISVPKGGNALVTLKADMTPYADGLSSGSSVAFKVNVPTSITGATTNTLIAKGASSGAFAATTSTGDKTAYNQYPYRSVFSASLATTHTATGNARSANDKIASLTLGSNNGDALLRAALEADDEATTSWALLGTTPTKATSTTKIDGTYSITMTGDGSAATGDAIYYDFGASAGLNGYTKASFWFRSGTTVTAGDVKFFVNDTANLTTPTQNTSIGAVTADTWTYETIDLTGLGATDEYVGLQVAANAATYNSSVFYIDNLRFYNDSVVLNLAGDLNATAPVGAAVALKISGTQMGIGYYTGSATTGTVTIIPDYEISLNAGGAPYDLWVSTTALMKTDTTANEVLSMSVNNGTPASAGDFRWYDQAVSATSPITWINPVSGVNSVSAGY